MDRITQPNVKAFGANPDEFAKESIMAEFLEDPTVENTDGQSIALPAAITKTRQPPPPVSPLALTELPGLKRADGNFVTTLTLNSRTCKWPIGDPTDRNFHYCGRRPGSGRPYCDAHELRSYQPLRSRANQRSFLRTR
jgi:GcrA cell cycle regulator